ncbi:hypothetical protein AN963_19115 [Brevibacillus choshinensis]|uniref:Uncharacterized protein n=1 Tax=Brevibacillus choshinensis TaxID=54911 RepID=A0ABR5N944_BRECH|nr:hypothetical protein AN963_19115 [Brevibacillus choshinensis]
MFRCLSSKNNKKYVERLEKLAEQMRKVGLEEALGDAQVIKNSMSPGGNMLFTVVRRYRAPIFDNPHPSVTYGSSSDQATLRHTR